MLLFLYLHASKWLFSLAWSESQFKKKWGGGGGGGDSSVHYGFD